MVQPEFFNSVKRLEEWGDRLINCYTKETQLRFLKIVVFVICGYLSYKIIK